MITDIVVFLPATFYAVTARDNNPDCENAGETFEVPEFYSNGGLNCSVQCGRCGKRMEILTATVLTPQPVIS